MNKPSTEHLLKERLQLEKDKATFPEFLLITENSIKNIEKILKERGVLLAMLGVIGLIWYIAYNPPTELVIDILEPLFR